ncbi:MAG: hypothetical protein VX617_04480, partial [Pseudomonadota bacterium]|nr:hypothetical protein [Pseudomonadota bacterium]
HELPVQQIESLLDEVIRVLRPGSRMIHLDFYCVADAFGRFIHYGHANRNNEPYMEAMAELDIAKMLKEKGLVNINVVPFAETDGINFSSYPYWRFPWTIISAEKIEKRR